MNRKYEDGKYQQHVDDMIVRREVLYCQSMLVDELLKTEALGFQWEDIENNESYIVDGEDYSPQEWENHVNEIRDEIDELEFSLREVQEGTEMYDNLTADLQAMQNTLDMFENDYDIEPAEVYEWWLVRDWLARKLRERGQCLIDNDYGTWWGRQTTGQSIHLDKVICDIHDEYFPEWNRENGYE